jgi:hypothetical protein
MFDIHFCLISEQATPNLVSVLNPAIRPKEVIMLVSNPMRHRAEHLEGVLSRHQIKTRILPFEDAYDIAALESMLLESLDAYREQRVAMNLTGGTKTMTIAAQFASSASGVPMFYVRPDTNQLLFVGDGDKPEPITLDAKLTLQDYLAAHGYEIVKTEKALHPESAELKLADWLGKNVRTQSAAIKHLNWIAQRARKAPSFQIRDADAVKNPAFCALLEQDGMSNLAWKNGEWIVFENEAACAFLNGGWLEQYVAHQIRQINGKQDMALNLEFRVAGASSTDKGRNNEIDVATLVHNRLYMVECKTADLDTENQTNTASRADEVVYKLEALRKTGGLNTRKLLVSALPLAEASLSRAKDNGITVIGPEKLGNLKSVLESEFAK